MLSQASETLRNVELKLNFPNMTVSNSNDSQGCYSSYALRGSDWQKAESCFEMIQSSVSKLSVHATKQCCGCTPYA